MTGILLLAFAIAWLGIDIFIANRMAQIEDQGKFMRMRLVFIVVNIIVIVFVLGYMYTYFRV